MKNIPDKICVIPWIHLNIDPDGTVIPCCIASTHNPVVGNVSEQSLEDIWNSSKMKSLRKEFMEGKEPIICDKCFNKERAGNTSTRQHNNDHFPHVIKRIPSITLEDGTCTEFKLRYWDFRFSNICNYKCRSCGPRHSSSWAEDARTLGYNSYKNAKPSRLLAEDDINKKVIKIDLVNNKKTTDFIYEHIDEVERIYFAVGDPLLMDENWYILDKLHRMKKFNVKIFYNTNMSTLKSKNKHILDYWKDFKNIDILASIDEIDKRAEIIRSGTNWKRVENNLIEMSNLQNITVRPSITVSAMNVFRIPEIVQRFIDIGVINKRYNYSNLSLNHLFSPNYYHVSILTDERRRMARSHLRNFFLEMKLKYNVNLKPMFNQVMYELNKPHTPIPRAKFFKVTESLDFIRNEKMLDAIPEILS